MRLTHVTLSGFRRFAEMTSVRLDGSVIAVIGPNEAGKTTFLDALESFDTSDPLSDDDPTRDITDAKPEIVASFELDESDRAAIEHIPGGQDARRSPPVLLIDEAETHLSYDAQANLAATLADQDVAQLVVYSTHSAGCLPPDLGTGIRAVIPEENGERSSIENGFWHKGPGYTPLLLAMGASALAFTPARRVVVGEGASECILLPTLLREASGQRLSFQVAPGLSNVSKAAMRDVLSMAGEVAYLVDGDTGGESLKENLISLGFPAAQIVSYRDVGRLNVTLEDLVHPRTFTRAVNSELRRWQGDGPSVTQDEVPRLSRMTWLGEWCQDHGLQDVNKPVLAQRIVDLRGQEPLVDPGHRERLVRLLSRLESVLAQAAGV